MLDHLRYTLPRKISTGGAIMAHYTMVYTDFLNPGSQLTYVVTIFLLATLVGYSTDCRSFHAKTVRRIFSLFIQLF